ncbi:MAG TPA: alpha/beta hydrolase [Ohtaekwangia sp.]|uniref:alpha/beta fold hydrolase n=1 Tax=Ohtaekwangia sp. TaxID=2066019 RepID=UPI002F958CE0
MKKTLLLIIVAGIVLLALSYFVVSFSQETQSLTNEERSEAPGNFIRLDQGIVHYALQGNDTADLIVFIHGGGITGMEVWNNTIPFFQQKGFQTLSYDLYGRGYTDRPETEYTPELMVHQLSQLLDTLNISKRFTIVSMSMGAMIALEYTSKNPERVKEIVFLDPATTGDFKPNPLLKVPVVSDLLMTFYWYPKAIENQRKEFVDQALFENYSKRLAYFMNFEGYKYINHSTWMHTLNQRNIELLKGLHQKVLLLYGEKDPYFPAGNIAIYQSLYPAIQHHAIPNAGHMPHFERPSEVNPIIYEFLTGASAGE